MQSPRIVLMADYRPGLAIAKYLKERGERIVALVHHPARREAHLNRGCTQQIIALVDFPQERVFNWDDVRSRKRLEELRALEPDILLTMFCCGILPPEIIAVAKQCCINMHLAYLPYNRGKNPNAWAIAEGTPAGVTMHYIDPGIDTGDIIAQTEVPVTSVDTAGSLYFKLEDASIQLFTDTWPKILDGTAPRVPQDGTKATFRYAREFSDLDVIDLDRAYTGRDLINRLRARTFPPHPSAYFIDGQGRKVYVRVQLEYGADD